MKKWFIVILLASLGLFLWAKSHRPADTPEPAEVAEPQPEEDTTQKVQSFLVSGSSEDGKSKWEVEGESADIFSETVDMRQVKAKTSGSEVSVTLTADEGTFFKNTKDVELRSNVVTNTDEGTTVKADKMKWLAQDEKIVTDDEVHIIRQDADIYGKGAEVSPKNKKAQLNENIKMDIKPKTVITCDGPLEVDYKNNISYFNKNVVIEDDQGKIFADKVIVYINPKEKRISKAVARGHVKIMHKQNTTYSREAVYLPDEKRVVLVGRPKVVIYSTEGFSQNSTKEKQSSL